MVAGCERVVHHSINGHKKHLHEGPNNPTASSPTAILRLSGGGGEVVCCSSHIMGIEVEWWLSVIMM